MPKKLASEFSRPGLHEIKCFCATFYLFSVHAEKPVDKVPQNIVCDLNMQEKDFRVESKT